jgi:DNA-binding NarL/FixJ family response regulator
MDADASVLIVDEDESCREELARVLALHGFSVVEAAAGDDALALSRDLNLCAAILEIPLAGLSGYELCRRIKAEHGPGVAVIFLSGVRTESYDRVAGLLVGADDYLVKPVAPGELVTRLGKLIRRQMTPPSSHPKLTRREHEILALMGGGLPHAEIARRLFISPKTVATHVEHILRKLGVRSRAQAVAVAYRDEILRPADMTQLPIGDVLEGVEHGP